MKQSYQFWRSGVTGRADGKYIVLPALHSLLASLCPISASILSEIVKVKYLCEDPLNEYSAIICWQQSLHLLWCQLKRLACTSKPATTNFCTLIYPVHSPSVPFHTPSKLTDIKGIFPYSLGNLVLMRSKVLPFYYTSLC